MIQAIPTEHRGITFRSRTEARWAEYFWSGWVPFQYEPEGFHLEKDWYVPDFLLTFPNVYFEVKAQAPNEREERVARALAKASNSVVVIAPGNPSSESTLLAFDHRGRRTEVYFSHDNDGCAPWLGEEPDGSDGRTWWQVPAAESSASRGYGRDHDLDKAEALQFNKPFIEAARPEYRPYDSWIDRNTRRL